MSRDIKKLYKKYDRNKSRHSYKKYRTLLAVYKKQISKAKSDSWNAFKEKTKDIKDAAALKTILEGKESVQVGTFVKPDGSNTGPGDDSVNFLTSTHFPHAKDTTKTFYDLNKRCSLQDVAETATDWINVDRVRLSFQGFSLKKSPGPDELKPIFLTKLLPNAVHYLTFIYKACIKPVSYTHLTLPTIYSV